MDLESAWKGGNKRLKNIKYFQSQHQGQPLAQLPVGTRVAVYNYAKKSPRWDARCTIVRHDRTNQNSPITYMYVCHPS